MDAASVRGAGMQGRGWAACLVLAVTGILGWGFAGEALAQGSESAHTYTYDALGRLVKVQVAGGEQDGETRDYAYDAAGNRTQVSASGSSDPMPADCALIGSEMTSAPDTTIAWPRVFVAQTCDTNLTLSYTIQQVSGTGSLSDDGFSQSDPVLEASLPADETVKLVYITPIAASVPSGEQLVLDVHWKADGYAGAGSEAVSRVRIDGTGGSPCLLGPADFTTTVSGGYAWPRVYAPSSRGCGAPITLSFTLERVGGGSLGTTTAVFAGNDSTLGATEHAKVVAVDFDESLVAPGNPLQLKVHWEVAPQGGNPVIASPGYSLVTVNPDP